MKGHQWSICEYLLKYIRILENVFDKSLMTNLKIYLEIYFEIGEYSWKVNDDQFENTFETIFEYLKIYLDSLMIDLKYIFERYI